MTDWWSVQPQESEQEARSQTSVRDSEPEPEGVAAGEEPQPGIEPRRKAKKLACGAAGAIVVGLLAVSGVSGGSESKGPEPASAKWVQSPAVAYEGLPAAGGGPAEAAENAPSVAPVKREVTLTAAPAGRGRVGAVVAVSVHNGTDSPVMVLASLVKGDGHPGVVGEGTLSPGSRVIAPGDTAEGSIEFPVDAAPSQVVLVDLKGNIIAKENDTTATQGGPAW